MSTNKSNMNKKSYKFLLLFFVLLTLSMSLPAQSSHRVSGNMWIGAPGVFYVSNNNTLNLKKSISTTRDLSETQRGVLSFANTAEWDSDNLSFVDGFVRSYNTGAFIFPVGQTTAGYHPVRISAATSTNPTDAAYYKEALHSTTDLDTELDAVSNECWIVQGATSAIITLSWTTDISGFADDFSKLFIAGWDGSEWVKIASEVDATSPIFGAASALDTKGSISTTSALVPNTYEAYTLAVATPLSTCLGTVQDSEGNTYKVTELVGLCWTENLKSKKYADDSTIPFAQSYNNLPQNETDLGLLYTYASLTSICPAGWRIPTAAEWEELLIYDVNELNNTTFWLKPNGYTNITDFDIRGAGIYNSTTSRFEQIYGYTAFWSADADSETATAAIIKHHCDEIEMVEIAKTDAASVRCVME